MPRPPPSPLRLTTWLRNNRTALPRRLASTQTTASSHDVTSAATSEAPPQQKEKKNKTVAQLDEELRQKMSGLAGDGGEAGVEYEDGKPVAMRRGVRENMFRYI